MTDEDKRLTEIMNSKRMFKNSTLFNSQTEKLVREIAKEYAAIRENNAIDRLLDCLSKTIHSNNFTMLHRDGKMHSWEFWRFQYSSDRKEGTDKQSLLKVIGFTND